MKIAIDIGHNCHPDIGAVGIKAEDELVKLIGTRLGVKLIRAGYSVIFCTPSSCSSVADSLRQRVAIANTGNADLYVSLHFNAFNGEAHGSEVFAISPQGKKAAASVLKEIVELGYRDRGVKDGRKFFVLKHTRMPAILIECCFVDAKRDMDILDVDKMVAAILRGLTA